MTPGSDAEVPAFTRALGLPGLTDLHVHFLPDPVQRKVWAFFDRASAEYGTEWPIHYRLPVDERLAILRDLGVVRFAPLVYPHKPDMAAWLNEWVRDFAAATPEAVPTATFFPEPGAAGYLADAAVPVVVHCGHGPVAGKYTGLDVFEDVLRRHPRLVAVLAHAGAPEFSLALDLVDRYDGVHLDTTMVGVPFNRADEHLPDDWIPRLAAHPDRVALGTDFPSIPYDYATQLRAIAGWAAADDRLGENFLRAVLWDTPRRLLSVSEHAAETS